MRIIDIYRGSPAPANQFNIFSHPEYQKASKELSLLWKELEQHQIPPALLNKIEAAQNRLSAVELDLMWCFAFSHGVEFQCELNKKIDTHNLS